MLRATLKSLLARKVRLILSGLAVVLGVMFVSGAFVLTDTLGRSFDNVFADAYSETDVLVTGRPNVQVSEMEGEQVPATVPAATVERVKQVPNVAAATGVVAADGARLIGSNGKVVTSFGPPQLGENWVGENELVQLREGRGPKADDEIVVNASLAEAAGVRVGDRVGVLTLQPKKTFTLVGIFGYSGGRDSIGGVNEVAFTTPVAQELILGQKGVYNSVDVRGAEGVDPAALRADVAAALGGDYVVRTGEQVATDEAAGLKEGLQFFNYILLGFAGVALFVGIFIILNTFSIIVAQRTRELALMRAIGAGRRQVIGSVLIEAVVIGLIASIIGLAAGIGVGALLAYLFSSFSELSLAGLGVPASAVIAAFGVGLVVTVVAAVIPAVRASRVPPMAALHDVATPDRPLTRVTVAGALVSAAGGTLLGLGLTGNAGDNTLWTILGGVLVTFIGVALLTPILSRPIVSLLGRLFAWSVPGKLGRLNSGRNPRRTAITAAALMVGIALVTGVNVILDSARTSISGAVQSIDAQLIVAGVQAGPRPPTFDGAVVDKAAALPGVRAAVGVYSDRATVDGQPTFVNAATDAGPIPDIYDASPIAGSLGTLRPDQMIVNEDAAKDRGLAVGDQVTVQLSRGEPKTYTVTGIAPSDKSVGSFLLPRDAARDFAIPQPSLAFVQLTDGTPVSSVKPQLDALVADSPEVSVVDQAAFTEQQTSGLDQLLVMIQILLALAILIAILGIVNTLALSVIERTREIGLLRAIGLGRAQTMRMVTVESVVISVFGALLGVAVGAGMGAAVVRALRDQGFTDLTLPWSQMAVYVGLAGVVGVVAAVLPSIRAARLNVLAAIAHE